MSVSESKKAITLLAFASLEEAGLSYCGVGTVQKILDPKSRDIDIFVNLIDVLTIRCLLERVYKESGWIKIKEIQNEYSLQLFFLSGEPRDDLESFAQWDLMPWSSWRGVKFVGAAELIRNQVYNGSIKIINKTILDDYKIIRTLLCSPSRIARSGEAGNVLSEWGREKLFIKSKESKLKNKLSIRRYFVIRRFLRSPIGTLTGIGNFIYRNIRRYLSPPGVLLCALASDADVDSLSEEDLLIAGLPVTGSRSVSVHEWREFAFRLKVLRDLFLGYAVVVYGSNLVSLCPRSKFRAFRYLFNSRSDLLIFLNSDKTENKKNFRKAILKVLGERIISK